MIRCGIDTPNKLIPAVDLILSTSLLLYSDTRLVPMNLETNPEAISRAKAIADMAINCYNHSYNTSFVVVTVDQANCNAELCSYVDSDKYLVLYKPITGCICNKEDPRKCFCHILMFAEAFYITFTAKEEKSDVLKVFQAKAERDVDEEKESVTFFREKVVGSLQNQEEEKKVDEERKLLHQKFLEKIETSGLSLLDQPLYSEFEVKKGKNIPSSYVSKSYRPPQLAHIDEQVWCRYAEQIDSSGGFDIVDFPGVIYDTRIVPMNLETNPQANSRAKAAADLAINCYNYNNNTSFVVVTVDKANCNAELCSFVDSDKYIVLYEPIKECACNKDASKSICRCLMFHDEFYITFTAKEENSDGVDVKKVFQAKVERKVDENEDVVTFCREKVVGSLQTPGSQDLEKIYSLVP